MKLLRTMLFVPGNDPRKLLNAGIYMPDSLVFDLEDAVSVEEKDAARDLVRNALLYNEYPCEVGVRINPLDTSFGRIDLDEILRAAPAFIRLPKAEEEADVREVDETISRAEVAYGYKPNSIKIVLTIETARGILNSYSLAKASKRVMAIGIGAEDLAADLRAKRSKGGREIAFGRDHLLYSARAAGVMALDNVFSDVKDEAGFIADTTAGKDLGFDGKSIIHPNQVAIVHRIFTPTDSEIAKSLQVLEAYQEALVRKSGVIALNGKMIDGPIVTRAERVVEYARAVGKIRGGEGQ